MFPFFDDEKRPRLSCLAQFSFQSKLFITLNYKGIFSEVLKELNLN